MTDLIPEVRLADNSGALPPYGPIFRLDTWAGNTLADWPHDLSSPPDGLWDLVGVLGDYIQAILEREHLSYYDMCVALRAGHFGGY
jgi:hypothetical protein